MTSKKRKSTNARNKEMVTDFGIRSLNKQNNNRTVVVPRIALRNCGVDETEAMSIKLVQNKKGEKYIRMAPVCTSKKGEISNDL